MSYNQTQDLLDQMNHNVGIAPPPAPKAPAKNPYGLNEYNDTNGGAKLPDVIGSDSNQRGMEMGAFNNAGRTVRDLGNNFQPTSDRLYQGYESAAKSGLARSMRGIKNSYNSRGLLGSGMQGNASASLVADTKNDLATKRQSINQGLLGDIGTAENSFFGIGNNLSENGADTANPYLSGVQSELALQTGDDALASQAYGGLASGAGALAGTGLASLMRRNKG